MFGFDLRLEFRFAEFRQLPEEVRHVMSEKIIDQTYAVYRKVLENVQGKILQEKTGQLAQSIRIKTGQQGRDYVGEVFVDPETPKALALEYGGKDYYSIYPVNKQMLHFYWEKIGMWVYLDYVNHPPSKEFAYLRSALHEVNVEEGLTTILDTAIQNTLGR